MVDFGLVVGFLELGLVKKCGRLWTDDGTGVDLEVVESHHYRLVCKVAVFVFGIAGGLKRC